MSQRHSVTDADSSGESMRWTVRLSDKDPKKQIVIGLAAVTAGVAGAVLFNQLVLGFLGFAIILAATAEYWLGVSFSVGPKGASRRVGLSASSIEWQDVKRVIDEGEQIKLSPLEAEGRMDVFRGVTLLVTKDNRERVLRTVQLYTNSNV